ncbi:MAG: rhodanese-like domain-containing protein [Planctomycetota bacterium]
MAKGIRIGQNAHAWGKYIGKLGIDGKKPVVVLDDHAGLHAARVWFILKYFGVADVRLLNGFWKGWQEAKLPITKEKKVPVPVAFAAVPNEKLLATKEEIVDSIAGKEEKLQILDARTQEEFVGIKALGNPRVGHLPAACHLDWVELVDTKGSQRFKSPVELDKLLKKAGVDLSKPVVTHCQGGGRAAVMMFAAELMGAKEVSNYYSSFQEWSRDPNAPIESEKKETDK